MARERGSGGSDGGGTPDSGAGPETTVDRQAEGEDREIRDEIEFYLEMRARELVQERGLTPEEARREARRAFGDTDAIRARCRRIARLERRQTRRKARLNALITDVRYALRSLRRTPGFTAVVIPTVALAIGANAAIFSVLHGVLLDPLPYPEPGRLVRIFDSSETHPAWPVSPGNFVAYRDDASSFDSVAVFVREDLNLETSEPPVQLTAMRVSSGFFETLGGRAVVGRTFTRAEEHEGNDRVVVLGHELWRRQFGADPGVVGTELRLSGTGMTVVGVLEPGFEHVGGAYRSLPHGEPVDIWWPMELGPDDPPRNQHFLNAVGRLEAGVGPAEAEAELDALAAGYEERYPDSNAGWRTRVRSLQEEIVGDTRPMVWILTGAVGFLLLIACVNVANLMLARATTRRQEIAVRRALGAGRGRLVQQLLTESVVLAALGGALGVGLAVLGVRFLRRLDPALLPRAHNLALDGPVLVFCVVVTVATGLAFGLVPALGFRHDRLTTGLRESGRGGSAGRRSLRLRSGLVVAELALAFVLLAGAGLLLQSFVAVRQVDPGFRPDGVLTASLRVPFARYGDIDRVLTLFRDVDAAMSRLPGVDAAIASDVPWTGYDENSGFRIEDWEPPQGLVLTARYHRAGPGYFRTIGMPLLEGRTFTWGDGPEAPPVIVINEAMADRYWRHPEGAGEPLGSTVQLWGAERTVVGIVGDVKDTPTDDSARPAFWFPLLQQPDTDLVLVVHTPGDPLSLGPALRRAVRTADPALPIGDVRTLESVAAAARADARFVLSLVGSFAVMALTLAAAGIYGVVAYSVGRRRREIGIRMAMGARPGTVVEMVLRHGLGLAMVGLGLGLAGALLLTRLLRSLLFEVSATDPPTLLTVAVVLLGVTMAGCLVPAWRAARVDPLEAFR